MFEVGDEVRHRAYDGNEIIEEINKAGEIKGRYVGSNELSSVFCGPEDYKLIKKGTKIKNNKLTDGMKVSCKIMKNFIKEGVVTEEKGKFYICQDLQDGISCKNKKGFNYSWWVNNGDKEDLVDSDVTDLVILNQSLKERIEALDNGWDKEADDILKEILGNAVCRIFVDNNNKKIGINLYKDYPRETFYFDSQCSKNRSFKNMLLWLANKEGLLDAKEGNEAVVEVNGTRWEAKLVRKI